MKARGAPPGGNASHGLPVAWGKSLPFSGSQFSPVVDNNSCPGKVQELISPGRDLQPQGKQQREPAKGEGRGTAGSCEGLMISMVTHSIQERRRGLGPGDGGLENEGFTKKASSCLEKGLLENTALGTRTDCAVILAPLQMGRTGPRERTRVAIKSPAGPHLNPVVLTSNLCSSLYQNVVSLKLGVPICITSQLKGVSL